jgi:RimJ/RimL family protein N-acetyltransferase
MRPPPLPVLSAPWTIRFARPVTDPDLLTSWMRAPHVVRYWRQPWGPAAWRAELTRQFLGSRSRPYLVFDGRVAVAYLEIYRVRLDVLGTVEPAAPDDLGVHIAIGDATRTGTGLGSRLLRTVVDAVLAADPRCARVLAEPDEDNIRSIRAFGNAGFRSVRRVTLPDKSAVLMVRKR